MTMSRKLMPQRYDLTEVARVLGRHWARTVIEGSRNPATVQHAVDRLDELFEVAKEEARRAFTDHVLGAERRSN